LKKTANVPVIVAGRLCDPRMIMKAVETDRCDIAAISRPMMADPQMPRKMMEGRLDDVRMCTACCYCMSEEGWGKNCAINPDLSRELILPKIESAKVARRILVIGGGPGGMEAARILSERGHEVTLCEKKEHLGGALFTASAAPLTREWRSYTKWHMRQIEKLGVRVHLGLDVTKEYVQAMGPDAVVLATGGSTRRDVPGAELGHVVIEDDALLKKVELGDRIVVLGGAFWDVETAISLAAEGKKVTLIREEPGIAMMTLGLPKGMPLVREMLRQKGIKTFFAARVERIETNGVMVLDDTGMARSLKADSVVLSMGRISNRRLVEELQEYDCEIHQIGDCVKPANVAHAVYGARIVAATL
jgi:NADPH-dependent 2,4-dienoyl-CoA reductase/sulfur reductase-like enzyme